jgi:hypothetical protein
VTFEITTRWGDTLVEVSHAEDSYALCGTALIAGGVVVAPPSGRIALVDYEICTVERVPRTLPHARSDARRVALYVMGVLAVHLGIWAAATTEPPEEAAPVTRATRSGLARARFNDSSALADLVSLDHAPDTKGNGRAASAARGAEGRAGATSAPRETGHVAVQNTGEEPQLAKTALVEQARRAGILGSTGVMAEQFRSLAGDDKLASGFDPGNTTAPFDGGDGAAAGAFGAARRFEGTGGGGMGNTLGTIGRGAYSSGTDHGHAWGGTAATPQPSEWRTAWTYAVEPYRPIRIRSAWLVSICGEPFSDQCSVDGDLDPALVRRHVKRSLQRLDYCYERELLAHPDLAVGPIFVDFVIHGGRVTGATATGGDPTVASCTRDVIANLEFPAIGTTQVTYVLVYRKP